MELDYTEYNSLNDYKKTPVPETDENCFDKIKEAKIINGAFEYGNAKRLRGIEKNLRYYID